MAPHVDEWDAAQEFPRALYRRAAELGFLGLKYPVALGGQGGDYVHDAVWAEELAAAGAGGGVGAGLGAHTGIATPPVWKFGTQTSTSGSCAPRSPARRFGASASPSRARARTSPSIRTSATQGAGRLRRERRQDLHHERSPRGLPRLRGQDHRRRRPPRDLVPAPRAGDARVRGEPQAREDGLARVGHGRTGVHRRRGAGREPARAGERRLLPDHGQLPVGAAADGTRRGRRDEPAARRHARLRAASARRSAARSAASRRSATSSPRSAQARGLSRADLPRAAGIRRPEADRREAILRQEWTHPSITAGLEEVTKAKLLTQRAAVEVADECLQIHGGYGYMREYGIERALRDLRLGPIGGGTDEVMKEILGKQLGL